MLRLFVDGVVAGEKPTHAVRRLRPHLKKPNVLACKWKARPEVQAAIAERQAYATGLEERITKIEEQLASVLRDRDPADAEGNGRVSGLGRDAPPGTEFPPPR